MNREDIERAYARKGRVAGITTAVTMVAWYVGTTLVAYLGGQPRFVFLFDMMALALFVWIFAQLWQMWRMRQMLKSEGQG